VGVNWLGDAIMSMPAIQCFREAHPDDHLALLTKPHLQALWEMHAALDEIIPLAPNSRGVIATARSLRTRHYHKAYVLPNSFRSAIVPRLAGIPVRIGARGQFRPFALTEIRDLAPNRHQSYEVADMLGVTRDPLPPPRLAPPDRLPEAIALPDKDQLVVGMIPGAARGPSKRWPESYFTEVATHLTEEHHAVVVLLGTKEDAPICTRIASACGTSAINAAGRTNLKEFAALLKHLHAVVANDSGGMHLAAALGTPVVAIFGITDPDKTGPLGEQSIVLQHSENRSRKVARNSSAAIAALQAVSPDEVLEQIERIVA
jgi:heptosyltransferase-2